MSKLPLLEKNSYLKITYDQGGLYANLAYTDYNAERAYIVSKFTPLPHNNFNPCNFHRFWTNYLQSLEDELSWNFMAEGEAANIVNDFVDEGEGIKGLKVLIDQSIEDPSGIVKTIRSEIPQAFVEVVDDEYYTRLFDNFMDKFGYKEVIWVNLDLYGFRVEQYLNDYSGKNKDNLDVVRELKNSRIINEVLNLNELESVVNQSTVNSFRAEEAKKNVLEKNWFNYINSEIMFTSSADIMDLLRSLVTVKLLALLKEKEGVAGFGSNFTKPSKEEGLFSESALVVTGNLTSILDFKSLLLSLLDGMQLDGHLDLFVDEHKELLAFGESYFFGVNSNDIILNKAVAIPEPHKLLIPIVPREKSKLVLNGRISSADTGQTELHAVSGVIQKFDLEPYRRVKSYLEFKLMNGAGFEDLGSRVEFYFDPDRLIYESLLIDTRIKPVVYGPEPKKNKIRIEEWFANE